MEHLEALVTVPVGEVRFLIKEEPMGNDVSKLLEHVQCVSSRGNHAKKKKIDCAKPFNVTHHYHLN